MRRRQSEANFQHGSRSVTRIVLLMGVSGCGKSTTGKRLAAATGWPFRDADTFHPPANVAKMSQGIPLEDRDREPWLDAIAAWMEENRRVDSHAIVSCSALKRRYRDRLRGGHGDVALVYLKGSMTLIGERVSRRRGHFMPPALLASQFAALEEPTADERPLIVPVHLTPRRITDLIVAELGLSGRAAP